MAILKGAISEGNEFMDETLPTLYIARHGETAWSLSGQYTGLTDLPLTERGERNAQRLGNVLRGHAFEQVFSSPLKRARRTCDLAGFAAQAHIDNDLVEWNYGKYDGLLISEILRDRPDWDLFRDGCPEGESPFDVQARADRVLGRLRALSGDALIFSSGHFLRVLTARWLGLESEFGKYFVLSAASLSMLGYEHNRSQPGIRLWNDTHHLMHH